MFERFTDRARRSIVLAQEEARSMQHSYIGTEHIFLGLLSDPESLTGQILSAHDITHDKVKEIILEIIGAGTAAAEGHIPFTPRAKKVLELALRESVQLNHSFIGTEHILLGLIRDAEGVAAQAMVRLGVDPARLRAALLATLPGDNGVPPEESEEDIPHVRLGGSRRGKQHSLDEFAQNLTQYAREDLLDPVIGREKEIERIMQVLSRRTKNNPVLVGEPGVGKTAVVEGLAQAIVAGDVPETLKDKEVYSLDLPAMVAGSRYRGDFEERLKNVLKDIKDRGNIIIFLDEIHTLTGAGGGEGSLDAASILKPMLARGELQTVGATTFDEYRKHIEKDAALERRFQPIQVGEPSVEDTVTILKGLRSKYEKHHEIEITDRALDAAARLSDRYVTGRFLPDKAIDLIDEAGSRLRIRNLKPEAVQNTILDEEMIGEVLAASTGVPVTQLSEEDTSRLLRMEAELGHRVIGQVDAVAALSRAIRRTRAGLKDPNRPGGSFIFAGPSGVGKTELSKALAEFMFGNEDALISLDMSEYGEKHTASRLFGSPPGYVGYEEGGQLTEKVRRKPFSVILFDEVEKAHPDIFNSLLQILEEGRLTDSQGRVVDFKNTVIIMTTNLGSRKVSQTVSLGFGSGTPQNAYEQMKKLVAQELKENFRPEFLNRVDDVIVFHQLTMAEIFEIVDLMITSVDKRLKDRDMGIELTPAAKELLAERGYDTTLGARPLRRTIQRDIEDALSEKILFGELTAGHLVLVDVATDGTKKDFTFTGVPMNADPETLLPETTGTK